MKNGRNIRSVYAADALFDHVRRYRLFSLPIVNIEAAPDTVNFVAPAAAALFSNLKALLRLSDKCRFTVNSLTMLRPIEVTSFLSFPRIATIFEIFI